MYKYYKNVGKKGDNRGDVLKIIMQNIWKFFTEMCHNDVNSVPAGYDPPVDYDIDYYRVLDQHTTLNLVDPLLQGNQLFGQYFSLEDEASPDYQNIVFRFDWMKYPVIMYVPKQITSYIYKEYDVYTQQHNEVYNNPSYIYFTFNPTIFSSNYDEYYDSYTKHKIYSKLVLDNDDDVEVIRLDKHYAGLTYEDCTVDVFPIWGINPFSNVCAFVNDTDNAKLYNNLSMFISLEDHNFILGFVDHADVDYVYFSFISSMPDSRELPSCDIKSDFIVRSDLLAFKRDIAGSDTFVFSASRVPDDPFSRDRATAGVSIMAVNATVDSNVDGDILFPNEYPYNIHSYKNVRMFDNQEKMCWVNNWVSSNSDNYFKAGTKGHYLDRTIKVPTITVYITDSARFPLTSYGEFIVPRYDYYEAKNGDTTYHDDVFHSMLRNTLNSYIILFPAFVCVIREPLKNEVELSSAFCRLSFLASTDVMYHHNRDIFDLNILGCTYLCFEAHGSNNTQICLLVDKKLDPAI